VRKSLERPEGRLATQGRETPMEGVEAAMAPLPTVGQHTETILRELGVDAQTIDRLRQSRAI
jgi:crotonobetainyl-CoA:carnitine CoA-transferase CaiB-like acyl-CoA transferase